MHDPLNSIVLDTLRAHYGLEGSLQLLHGELDLNYRFTSGKLQYLVKLSRPETDPALLDFQEKLLLHLRSHSEVQSPSLFANREGTFSSSLVDGTGKTRHLRVLSWIEGRIWSEVHPIRSSLRESLGTHAGMLTAALLDFEHPYAHRPFEWDLAQASWTHAHRTLFDAEQQALLSFFQARFEDENPLRAKLRKAVVHNDVNDQNILVDFDLKNPHVTTLIDFGDAIYTQCVHDLAITLAYAIMDTPDPLAAAREVIQGYHAAFPLEEAELQVLYSAIGMRLVVSVTKSALNRAAEPENTYHQISAASAWKLLRTWQEIHPHAALCHFRYACGFEADPCGAAVRSYLQAHNVSLNLLLPSPEKTNAFPIDFSVGSTWLGTLNELSDFDLQAFRLKRLQEAQSTSWIAGGYMEPRIFYSTDAYRMEGNDGPEHRSVHLGVDLWMEAGTKVCAPLDGIVVSVKDNAFDKDYGPTVILEHRTAESFPFYSLYGHLSRDGMRCVEVGKHVLAGEIIGSLGNPEENGGWLPHLHFQFMTHLLDNTDNFDGVCRPSTAEIWRSLCPDPAHFFIELQPTMLSDSKDEILRFRKAHLGKSLSISYRDPLHIVRGDGACLIDAHGQRYLDTVNNVAHVGHEHPYVVKKGSEQMAILNTNTRYLHGQINALAENLLSTFPEELCVAHFVNSGSEANELALRMARACTGQRDIIAVEMGYHGNTAACIDISSYKFDGKGGSGKPEYTSIVPLPDSFRGLHRGEGSGSVYAEYIREQIEILLEKRRKPAAFICESIISCGGQIELPKDYLKEAYAHVRAQGGVCISDEVQVGCGRVGAAFWGFELHGVMPDIVTIGKPLGNGHPLAAVVCTQRVAEAFANGMEYFNTFGGNPVSCAIGNAVLDVVKKEALQKNARETGNYLKAELSRLSLEFPILADVRGQGLFLGIEFTDADMNPLPEHTSYIANRMRERKILMSTDGKDNNVLKVKPPLIFSISHAELLLENLRSILQEDFLKIC